MVDRFLLSLIATVFLIFLLGAAGAIFRTYSEILYRRSRTLTFQSRAGTSRAGARRDRPLLVAVLLLAGIAVMGKIVGVAY